ncbi:hypothetical protein N9L68_02320 [bacterium]|nr:hypothetical protein [bacterium]
MRLGPFIVRRRVSTPRGRTHCEPRALPCWTRRSGPINARGLRGLKTCWNIGMKDVAEVGDESLRTTEA